jgi:hypothetical protein
MIGIPIQIIRDGKDETIYLSTRRSGVKGGELRDAKRAYRQARLEIARLTTKMSLIAVRVNKIPDEADHLAADLEKLCDDMDKLTIGLDSARQAVQDAAEHVISLAIEDNHGQETASILDCLTDSQIEALVSVLETGETPADFFPSRATQPSAKDTTPPAAGPGASSPKPALPDLTGAKAG